jgi:hypothetical protein
MLFDASADRPCCEVAPQYPAPCVGKWLIKCSVCGVLAIVTAAGRPDDPHTARLLGGGCTRIRTLDPLIKSQLRNKQNQWRFTKSSSVLRYTHQRLARRV